VSVLKFLPLLLCASPLFPQSPSDQDKPESSYAGPSILSRGFGPSASSTVLARFRPYVSVDGEYDSQLTSVSLRSDGKVASGNSVGAALSYGISGSHRWKSAALDLNFRGDFRHYSRTSYNDGTDQTLDLNVQTRIARRVRLNLGLSGGTYSSRFGYTGSTGYYDPLFTQRSTADLFDNTTIFAQTTARLIYQKSTRLSFSFGGTGFLVRRRSSALYGATGYGAAADVSYRVTRFASIGADYAFQHYEFIGVFGTSNIHSEAGNLSLRLSKNWELGLRAGVFRAENLLLQVVKVDPVIAAITGQSSGIAANYSIVHSPMFNARLNRAFRRGGCGLTYSRGVTPGNGILLASRSDAVGGDCSYSAQRSWNFNIGVSYSTLSALEQTIAAYRYADAHAGVTRSLKKGMFFSMRAALIDDMTKYGAFNAHKYYRASIGFTYSPGDIPLSLW
jgi:hypothetical protein